MLIFFALELMKIHITQTAIDTICAEMTFDFIATRSWNNFTSIMEKYRPSFIPKKGADGYDVIRFTIDSYTNLEEMMVTNAHGGASVHYPDYGSSWAGFDGASPHYVAASACIPVDGIDIHCAVNCAATRNYLKANNFPYGRAFVLDATVAYPFSSSFVKKLFNGGSNSRLCSTGTTNKNTTPKGDSGKYILWARGIGVTN
jgi:hypothetical protein